MKRVLISLLFLQALTALCAQKPLSLVNTFYATLNNYVLQNDHIEYQKLMNMCDAGFRVSDRFAQEQSDIPSQSLLLQNYLELLRDKQVKLAITDMREITLSNHRTEGAPTKTVLVNLSLSSPKVSTYKLRNVVYIRNNKIFCVGDYEIDKSGRVLTELVNNTNRTSTNNNIHNGHEYVDLGLSVMWATCNVGASRPEDYGAYFQWGETKAKSVNCWNTYSKTNSYGKKDKKILLEITDDAATSNWGGRWRIPTLAEVRELHSQCTWFWTTQNGVNGYIVTGANGNSIFLPAAGFRYDYSIGNEGSCGYYWSSVLNTDDVNCACGLYFSNEEVWLVSVLRCHGCLVRPIYN